MSTFEEMVQEPLEAQEDNTQAVQDSSQEPTNNAAGSENIDTPEELWKQSNEFKQGLWKTTDDVYNSVKYYQQKFTPLEQSFKKLGFKEPTEFEQALKSYHENMPQYQEAVQTMNLFNALLQDPNHGGRLQQAIREIQRAKEVERYGIAFDELPEQIREKVARGEEAYTRLQELEQNQAYEQSVNTISQQIQDIEKIANDYNLEIDMHGFVNYCKENNIPPNMMMGEFMRLSYQKIIEKAQQNASMATSLTNKENKNKAVSTSTKTSPQSAPSVPKTFDDFEAELLKTL